MMDLLQVIGVVLLALIVLGFALGTVGPILAAFVVLPAMAVFGPLAECARLRRQNGRIYALLERPPAGSTLISDPPLHRSWWAYRKENLLLQGELAALGFDLPSAGAADRTQETRSERIYDWLDPSTGSPHIIAAAVLLIGVALVVLV